MELFCPASLTPDPTHDAVEALTYVIERKYTDGESEYRELVYGVIQSVAYMDRVKMRERERETAATAAGGRKKAHIRSATTTSGTNAASGTTGTYTIAASSSTDVTNHSSSSSSTTQYPSPITTQLRYLKTCHLPKSTEFFVELSEIHLIDRFVCQMHKYNVDFYIGISSSILEFPTAMQNPNLLSLYFVSLIK